MIFGSLSLSTGNGPGWELTVRLINQELMEPLPSQHMTAGKSGLNLSVIPDSLNDHTGLFKYSGKQHHFTCLAIHRRKRH